MIWFTLKVYVVVFVEVRMKILVIGAGVLGSLYAARLQNSGQDVTVLARGKRLTQLRENGIVLTNESGHEKSITPMRVIEAIDPEEFFDFALVLVRKNQMKEVLPLLRDNVGVQSFVFMSNNAVGPVEYIQTVGNERVLLGFPGAGGSRDENGEVTYSIVPGEIQSTTIGELNGQRTERVEQLSRLLNQAGFPTVISENMDAWLKTHVALVSPVANAIYLAAGDPYRLANTRDGLVLMVRAIREGLHVLDHLGVPITPKKYKLIRWVPEGILVPILQKGFATPQAELVLARHARSARDEMQQLGLEFQQLTLDAGVPTPNIDNLMLFATSTERVLPSGSQKLRYCYQDWVPVVMGVTLAGLLMGIIFRRKRK
ncbi:MAG: ketopantoate reductase [Anaerolineaceae bacterium]|nr:ketopantoate reductase [Anaerolineaceae bacterium]